MRFVFKEKSGKINYVDIKLENQKIKIEL